MNNKRTSDDDGKTIIKAESEEKITIFCVSNMIYAVMSRPLHIRIELGTDWMLGNFKIGNLIADFNLLDTGSRPSLNFPQSYKILPPVAVYFLEYF